MYETHYHGHRIRKAQGAIDSYLDGNSDNTALVDLLSDLLHWAEENKVDFIGSLMTAIDHYSEEKHDEDPEGPSGARRSAMFHAGILAAIQP